VHSILESKGFILGCLNVREFPFFEWVVYSTKKKDWNGKDYLYSHKTPETVRWHPTVWLAKGREVWGQFLIGPHSVIPLGRLPHVPKLQLRQTVL
jgi:hypothetical protein